MASGSISLTSSKAWRGQIVWSSTANTAGNYSTLHLKATMWKTDGYLTSSNSPTSGTITIAGTEYDLTGYQEFKDEVTIFETNLRISHNSDGTASVAISLSCRGQAGTSLASATLSGSGTAVLDTIVRSASLSAPSGILGIQQDLTITSDSSSLTYTITYYCGDNSGTICTKTSSKRISWTPPLSLASANTTGDTVMAELILTTYSGNTVVGTHTISVLYEIDTGADPYFTAVFSDAAGYLDTYGDYIQMKSRLKISVAAEALYGATIRAYKIVVNGETYTRAESITNELTGSGEIPISITVQDSRGKLTLQEYTVSVREYSPPFVSSLTVHRCNADGVENDQGGYVRVTFSATVRPMDGQNTASYQLEYKKSSDYSFTVVSLPDLTNHFTVDGETYIFAADTGSSYDVQLKITDIFGPETKSTVVSTAKTIMHLKSTGNGIGFGKVAEKEDTVDVGWNIAMNGNRITDVGDPISDGDAVPLWYLASLWEAIYPVGSIYLSTAPTSPAKLFGGTWERIKDTFLLASGDTYPAGDTGGDSEVTLEEYQIPSHTHPMKSPVVEGLKLATDGDTRYWPIMYDSDGSNNAIVEAAGSGEAHNNMPPYLAVYVWTRTA